MAFSSRAQLLKALDALGKQFSIPLPQGWLSCEASFKVAVHFGLPAGAKERATATDFGPHLRTFFSSRHDPVAFKYLAFIAAQHPATQEKNRGDLLALVPTTVEIQAARNWLLNVPKANQVWKDACEQEFAN